MRVISGKQWAAVTALLAAVVLAAVSGAQAPSAGAAPQRVKSASELQPATEDDKVRAQYFAKERTSEMTIQELFDLGGGGLRLQYIQTDERRPFLPVICFGSKPPGEACVVAESPDAMVRLEANLRKTVCSSEVVVAGKVTSQKAVTTSSGTALFTDYAFEAQQWLRPGTGAASIVVSEWGGIVEIAGKPFALTREGLTLEIGKSYILVLTTLPGTTGYVMKTEPVDLVTPPAKNFDPLPQVAKTAASCASPGQL